MPPKVLTTCWTAARIEISETVRRKLLEIVGVESEISAELSRVVQKSTRDRGVTRIAKPDRITTTHQMIEPDETPLITLRIPKKCAECAVRARLDIHIEGEGVLGWLHSRRVAAGTA